MTENQTAWVCPACGATMDRTGRRKGIARCPACRGVFIDVASMRGRRGGPPAWAPMVMSLVASLTATYVARRLRARKQAAARQAAAPADAGGAALRTIRPFGTSHART